MARPIGIRIHRGSELLEAQVFDRELIKIGRLTSAHLRLEDPKVSRIHAVIEFTDSLSHCSTNKGSNAEHMHGTRQPHYT